MKSFCIFALVVIAGGLLTACGSSKSETETTSIQLSESDLEKPVVEESELLPLESFQPNEADQEEAIKSEVEQSQAKWPDGEVQLDEQGFVEVAITPLNLNAPDETLDFSVGLNTHSVDLSMDLASLATLEADTGLGVWAVLWDAPSGGHHVSGVLSFPTLVDGEQLLEGASHLTLKIQDVDAPERNFTWRLRG
jgi:hypothetical protein